jgi:glycerol-3-phosphate dehydrogenase (NAD(P)+)
VKRICILGAGSWGTALSIALASRFDEVRLWARDAGQAERLDKQRENTRYLPGFGLPDVVRVSHDLEKSLANVGLSPERSSIALPARGNNARNEIYAGPRTRFERHQRN